MGKGYSIKTKQLPYDAKRDFLRIRDFLKKTITEMGNHGIGVWNV